MNRLINGKIILTIIAFKVIFMPGEVKANDSTLIIRNVTIIDGLGTPPSTHMDIEITDSRITNIYSSGTKGTKENSVIVDLSDHYVCPGLIDSHVHITGRSEERLCNALQWGITSLRDMAGDAEYLQDLVKRIENGELIAPSIYYSALLAGREFMESNQRVKMITPMRYELGEAPWCRMVEDNSNISQIITEAKEWGVTGVKMYAHLSTEQVEEIAKEAQVKGLKSWSHSVLDPANCLDIVKAGVEAISHFNGLIVPLDWDYNRDGGGLEFDNSQAGQNRLESIINEMHAKGTILDPTLAIFEWLVNTRVSDDHRSEVFKSGIIAVQKAYRNNVIIAAGTDLDLPDDSQVPPPLFRELALYVSEVGMQAIEAISCTTINAAKAIGIEQNYGSIEVGKIADIVVLRKNPLTDIENLKEVCLVIKHGKIAHQSK